MDWLPDDLIEAFRGSHELGIFVRFEFDEPLAMWFGINDIEAKITSVDSTLQEYIGGGQLLGIPELEVLINGTADRVEFTLSGTDPVSVAQLEIPQAEVRGKPVHVAITALDEYYQPIVDPVPVWSGRASFVAESSPPVSGTQNPSVTLALSVGSGDTMRERASASLWSDAQQQAIYPGDKFCAGTARLARGALPVWPTF